MFAFMVQQILFTPQPTAVSDKLAPFTDDSVTGDDDRNPVVTVGPGDGPDGSRPADEFGLLPVRAGRAAGNLSQYRPDLLLKGSSG